MTHGTFAVIDNDRNLPTVDGRKNQDFALFDFAGSHGRYFSSFPPFHLGGFWFLIIIPIYYTATVVLGPTDKPPTGQVVSQIMRQFLVRALFCPPSIYEQLVQEPEGLQQVKQLDFLTYAGGPLSTTTGNLLSQLTDVLQIYGSTETGAVQTLVPLREDWAYLEWHPSVGADMQPSADGASELVLRTDSGLREILSLSSNFPNIQKWHTKDLFRPHPSKPNLWQFHGRMDDIIVLSNGEKFNPNPSEAIISAHPLLSGVLIIGQGRFQAALLVETKDFGIPKDVLIEKIWPTIEQANLQAPGHARIIKSMIAIINADQSFERAAKGTMIRKMTAEKFSSEVDALYSNDFGNLNNGPVLLAQDDPKSVQEFVRSCVKLSFSTVSFEDDDDLFVLGLDSLRTVEITAMLKAGLEASDTSWLSGQVLYANPTVKKLSKKIYDRIHLREVSPSEKNDYLKDRTTEMAALVEKYTQDLPRAPQQIDKPPVTTKLTVVLTGSTGSLGRHLLRAVLEDSNIAKVYCLNRSADAQSRHEKWFVSVGLDDEYGLNGWKAEFIKVDYSRRDFGLSATQFDKLTSTTDILIHNAWKVDFNHSLESFEHVHIQGVRHLIDWSIASSRHPHIVFVSSISSVGNWSAIYGNSEPVPETSIESLKVAQDMGYGESKNVAERILNIANETCGVPISVLRVGQVAGPLKVKGVWNEAEWLPALIKTSKSIGYLPDHVLNIDWIPVDKLAATIVEILHFATRTEKSWVYNIVNPRLAPWGSLLDTIRLRLGSHVQIIPLHEWINKLEGLDRTNTRALSVWPAIKILDFYRTLDKERSSEEGSRYTTDHGLAASQTMATLAPVSKEWMNIWLDQWGY